MAETERCRKCGSPLSKSAPEGLCPGCLLRAAVQEVSPAEAGAAGSEAPTEVADSSGGGTKFGSYRVIGVLGEGGMGIVYLALQEQPIQRRVAIKVIKRGIDSRAILGRFESERQILALLNHPGIAQIYEAGTTPDHQPYFVMEYVQGIPITDYCDRNLLGVRERLELFRDVCAAVHHAHQRGIIHRDLKPSNVLVTVSDGKAVIKIIDFGLAKALNRESLPNGAYTEFGVLMGTPEYMSPEQASLDSLSLDTTTDVYSLGVILYELLVGALPFDRATLRRAGMAEICRILREEEPPKPTTRLQSMGAELSEVARHRRADVGALASQVRGDLEWITMKALEKDRTRRYASASEFAADVERHLRDEPVLAGPPSLGYAARKLIRRHRAQFAVAVSVLFAILAGLITSTLLYFRAERQREAAEWQAYKAQISSAQAEIAAFRSEHGKDILFTCPPHLRGWEWRRLYAIADTSRKTVYLPVSGRGPSPVRIGYLADTERVRVAFLNIVHDVDMRTGTAVGVRGPFGDILAMSRDGRRLLARKQGSKIGEMELIDLPAGTVKATLDGHREKVISAAFALTAPRFATASEDGEIRVCDAATGGRLLSIRGARAVPQNEMYQEEYIRLAISPDGSRIAFNVGSSVILWDGRTGRKLAELAAAGRFLDFTADGRRLLLASESVRVYEAATGRPLAAYTPPRGTALRFAAASPDDAFIAAHGAGRDLYVFDAKRNVVLASLAGLPVRLVTGMAFSPDGRRLVLVTFAGEVKIWEASTIGGSLHRRLDDTSVLAGSPDGSRMAAWAGEDLRLHVWEAKSGRLLFTRTETEPWSMAPLEQPALAFSLDSSELAATGPDGAIRILDAATGKLRAKLAGHERHPAALAFSPDESQLASASYDLTLRIWDRASEKTIHTLRFSRPVQRLAYSPDGRLLAVGLGARTVVEETEPHLEFVDPSSGKVLFRAVTDVPSPGVASLAFNGDGSRLAVMRTSFARHDGEVWDVRGRRMLGKFGKGLSIGTGVTWSHDGTRIFSGSTGRSMIVWDANRLERLLTLNEPSGRDVVLGADGETIYSAGTSGVYCHKAVSHYSARAEELVARMIDQHAFLGDAWAGIVEETPASPLARKAALDMFMMRASNVGGADRGHLVTDKVLKSPAAPASDYKLALRRASAGVEYPYGRELTLMRLGLAQYRTGKYQEAVKTLTRPEVTDGEGRLPATVTLAMACQRLGQKEKAREHLERARSGMKEGASGGAYPAYFREMAATLIEEAEPLIEGKRRR